MTPNELTQERPNIKDFFPTLIQAHNSYMESPELFRYAEHLDDHIDYLYEQLAAEKLRSSKLLEALKRMYYIFVEIGFREDGELAAPFNEVLSACESAKAQIKAYES